MAGSDLDGDEYTVIWDKDLAFEYNQTAKDYSAPKIATTSEKMSDDKFQEEMAKFFVAYLSGDALGRISNSHLANADLYGIQSQVLFLFFLLYFRFLGFICIFFRLNKLKLYNFYRSIF